MRLHYKGKYDLNPDALPHGEHQPNAKMFKEVQSTKKLGIIANVGCLLLIVLLLVLAYYCRGTDFAGWQFLAGVAVSQLVLFPHELLHAICFGEDVYLYTNWKQGMLFVIGPETMSKGRFIFMSLLPNLVFGLIPYSIGMLFPQYSFFIAFGALSIGMGFGDYYNVFNALTQMPKGARTYLYGFHSYWYMPQDADKEN